MTLTSTNFNFNIMPNNIHLSNEIEKFPMGLKYNYILLESEKKSDTKNILTVSVLNDERDFQIPDHESDIISEKAPVTKEKQIFNFNGKTILLVDDVSFNLSLLELFFRNTGATILFATNGREAIDACLVNPQVDMVLMDIQMPVMNGLDATRELGKLKPGMPVIAITAFVHSDDRQRCFDAGCVDFIAKPCRREDLLSIANNFL